MNERRLSVVGCDISAAGRGNPQDAARDMADRQGRAAELEHRPAGVWNDDEALLADLVRALHADRMTPQARGDLRDLGDASVVARPTQQPAEERHPREPATLLAGPVPTQRGAQAPILVVDDNDAARPLLVSMLSEAGHAVRGVASAREARHVLRHSRIALLLSEVSMPGETGLDLLQFVSSQYPATATLLISAREDPSIAHAAIAFGACGYLTKPVSRSAVLAAVVTALRRRDEQQREHAEHTELERAWDLRTLALSQATDRPGEASRHTRVLRAETIHRWARAAEFRETGIDGHLQRMSRCCGLLADKLGIHAESLELASVLHDVGKLAVPERILLKREPLNVDERLAMQTHAEIGYQMLHGSCNDTLDLAAVIARTHHEKFDGSGYPHGLSGSEIPLEGRIAAVADVFDALTSARAHRRAWSVPSTLAWMARQRGKHFDPDVLDALTCSIEEVMAFQGHGPPRDVVPAGVPHLDIPS